MSTSPGLAREQAPFRASRPSTVPLCALPLNVAHAATYDDSRSTVAQSIKSFDASSRCARACKRACKHCVCGGQRGVRIRGGGAALDSNVKCREESSRTGRKKLVRFARKERRQRCELDSFV